MKQFCIVVILLLMICGGFFLFFFLQKPIPLSTTQKQQALERLLGSKPVLTVIPRKSGWILYAGHYLHFSYPAAAAIYPTKNDQENTSLVENFQFQESSPKYFFVVQVIHQPDAKSFDDIPDVRLRRTQKNIYTESMVTIGDIDAVTFVRSDEGFEKSGFILAHGYVYQFVITASDPQLGDIFDHVIQSVTIQ